MSRGNKLELDPRLTVDYGGKTGPGNEIKADPASVAIISSESQSLDILRNLTSLLVRLLEASAEITANGTRAKDRCLDCANRFNHYGPTQCPCVCHDARKYLTKLAADGDSLCLLNQ